MLSDLFGWGAFDLTGSSQALSGVEIGGDGEIYPLQQDDNRTFEFWRPGFDFAYFSWEDVRRLAEASKTLYISGSMVTYGVSIHAPGNLQQAREPVFNFKLEGDFAKGRSMEKDGGVPDPITLIGTSCERYWYIPQN